MCDRDWGENIAGGMSDCGSIGGVKGATTLLLASLKSQLVIPWRSDILFSIFYKYTNSTLFLVLEKSCVNQKLRKANWKESDIKKIKKSKLLKEYMFHNTC